MKQRGKEKNRIKKNEDNLRDLWANVKCPNIRTRGDQGNFLSPDTPLDKTIMKIATVAVDFVWNKAHSENTTSGL